MDCFYFCRYEHKDTKNLNLICIFVSKLNVMQMQYIPYIYISNERITFPNVNLCNILSEYKSRLYFFLVNQLFCKSNVSLIFDI